jgi:predicted DNA-binding transcriptional regulator
MGKSFTKPEIYFLLLKGIKPKQLIAIGLKRSTVYLYSSKVPEIQMRLKELQKKLKEVK